MNPIHHELKGFTMKIVHQDFTLDCFFVFFCFVFLLLLLLLFFEGEVETWGTNYTNAPGIYSLLYCTLQLNDSGLTWTS